MRLDNTTMLFWESTQTMHAHSNKTFPSAHLSYGGRRAVKAWEKNKHFAETSFPGTLIILFNMLASRRISLELEF